MSAHLGKVWRDAVWASDLCPRCKLVALALAHRMNADGETRSSQEHLARLSSYSVTTVRRTLAVLADGWLTVAWRARPSGRGRGYVYRGRLPIPDEPPSHCREVEALRQKQRGRGRLFRGGEPV
jgi:hypothetical protein